jgi:hypothetical protein
VADLQVKRHKGIVIITKTAAIKTNFLKVVSFWSKSRKTKLYDRHTTITEKERP